MTAYRLLIQRSLMVGRRPIMMTAPTQSTGSASICDKHKACLFVAEGLFR